MGFSLMPRESSGIGIHVAAGFYPFTVSALEPDTLTKQDGSQSQIARFDLELDDVFDAEGNPAVIDAIANLALTPKTKLWGWLTALGVPPVLHVAFDFDQVLGCRGVAKIVDNPSRDGSQMYSRVEDIGPERAQASQASVVRPDGMSIDWTVFWATARERNISREQIAREVGGDIGTLQSLPIKEVEKLLSLVGGG